MFKKLKRRRYVKKAIKHGKKMRKQNLEMLETSTFLIPDSIWETFEKEYWRRKYDPEEPIITRPEAKYKHR